MYICTPFISLVIIHKYTHPLITVSLDHPYLSTTIRRAKVFVIMVYSIKLIELCSQFSKNLTELYISISLFSFTYILYRSSQLYCMFAGKSKASLVRSSLCSEILRDVFNSWERKEEREEYMLYWLLHQYLSTLLPLS